MQKLADLPDEWLLSETEQSPHVAEHIAMQVAEIPLIMSDEMLEGVGRVIAALDYKRRLLREVAINRLR
jgi:hypothetical protein